MGACSSGSKCVILAINLLFWAAAGVLMFAAVLVLTQFSDTACGVGRWYVLLPVIAMLLVGALLFLNSFLGCCGAVRESKKCLSTFMLVTLLVLLLEVSAATLAVAFRSTVTAHVKNDWLATIQDYSSGRCDPLVDLLQNRLQCCGCANATDWEGSVWAADHPGTVPASCCPTLTNSSCSDTQQMWSDGAVGCCSKLESLASTNLLYFAISGVTLAALQTLVMLTSCVLMRRRREHSYIHLDADLTHSTQPSPSHL